MLKAAFRVQKTLAGKTVATGKKTLAPLRRMTMTVQKPKSQAVVQPKFATLKQQNGRLELVNMNQVKYQRQPIW